MADGPGRGPRCAVERVEAGLGQRRGVADVMQPGRADEQCAVRRFEVFCHGLGTMRDALYVAPATWKGSREIELGKVAIGVWGHGVSVGTPNRAFGVRRTPGRRRGRPALVGQGYAPFGCDG